MDRNNPNLPNKDVLIKEFKPSKKLKKLYYIYIIIALIFGYLIWEIPFFIWAFIFMVPSGLINELIIITISIVVLQVIIFSFLFYWASKYYKTISYKITSNDIEWSRGVWIKMSGTIPYHKIQNINIVQGPIARKFKIGALRIQTAGYSATARPEITISGIQNLVEIRDLILEQIYKSVKLIEKVAEKESTIKKEPPIEKEKLLQKIYQELSAIKNILKNKLS